MNTYYLSNNYTFILYIYINILANNYTNKVIHIHCPKDHNRFIMDNEGKTDGMVEVEGIDLGHKDDVLDGTADGISHG